MTDSELRRLLIESRRITPPFEDGDLFALPWAVRDELLALLDEQDGLRAEAALLRWALKRIVEQDYRGSEPESHRIARTALSADRARAALEQP